MNQVNHTPLVLFPHQEEGVAWMLNREQCRKCAGGLLMDDCGVGKTPQVIATLAKNPQKTTLIVAPVNILSQWKAQLHRWVPEFKVLLYHSSALVKMLRAVTTGFKKNQHEQCQGTRQGVEEKIYHELYRRARTAAEDQASMKTVTSENNAEPRPLVVVTSYGKLTNREYEKRRRVYKQLGLLSRAERFHVGSTPLSMLHWDRVVLDECHLIRNHNTTRTRYVLALKARIRWGLTATPIHNGMQDYQCLLKFLGLKKWEIAHVLASHPALEKYLSDKARKEAEGKILDLSGGLDPEADFQILSKDRPRLTHDELTLRRTKRQVFSRPNLRPDHGVDDDDDDHHRPEKKRKISESKAPELPELTVDIVRVDFATREEEKFYRRLERAAQLEVFHHLPPAGGAGPIGADENDADLALAAAADPEISDQALFELILRLRQASVNPALVVAGYRRKFRGQFPANLLGLDRDNVERQRVIMTRAQWRNLLLEREENMMRAIGTPSKTRVLQKMLLDHRDEKSIIFCEFRQEMPLLQRDLAEVGITSVLYDGSLTLAARAEIVKRMSWTHAEITDILTSGQFFPGVRHVPSEIVDQIASYVSYQVIIVQINSGNAGLNLQMCSRVYYTNPNWNPCTEIQAWGRAHRLGQTIDVGVVKLVLSGRTARTSATSANEAVAETVDQRVLDVQSAKRSVMADILDDDEILFNGNEIVYEKVAHEKVPPRSSDLTRQELIQIIGNNNVT